MSELGIEDDLARAERVAETALTVPGVYALSSGTLAEAATYGARGKVVGVIFDAETVEIHVIATEPLTKPLPVLADEIRVRVASITGERPVDVVVEDLKEGETQFALEASAEREFPAGQETEGRIS